MKKIAYIHDFQSWEQEFSFYMPINVRFSETDMFGHMNNTVPFIYFEAARVEYINELKLYGGDLLKANDVIPVAADLQCDFLSQVYFGENIKVYIKVHTIGNSSIDVHYMGKRQDDSVCFTGRGALVNINKSTGKATPWSEEDRSILLNAMDPSGKL